MTPRAAAMALFLDIRPQVPATPAVQCRRPDPRLADMKQVQRRRRTSSTGTTTLVAGEQPTTMGVAATVAVLSLGAAREQRSYSCDLRVKSLTLFLHCSLHANRGCGMIPLVGAD